MFGIFLLLPIEGDFASTCIDTLAVSEQSSSFTFNSESRIKPKGYRAITKIKDGFLAAGSDGRIVSDIPNQEKLQTPKKSQE